MIASHEGSGGSREAAFRQPKGLSTILTSLPLCIPYQPSRSTQHVSNKQKVEPHSKSASTPYNYASQPFSSPTRGTSTLSMVLTSSIPYSWNLVGTYADRADTAPWGRGSARSPRADSLRTGSKSAATSSRAPPSRRQASSALPRPARPLDPCGWRSRRRAAGIRTWRCRRGGRAACPASPRSRRTRRTPRNRRARNARAASYREAACEREEERERT